MISAYRGPRKGGLSHDSDATLYIAGVIRQERVLEIAYNSGMGGERQSRIEIVIYQDEFPNILRLIAEIMETKPKK